MSHYDIHVGDVIKYLEMVMARTGTGKVCIITRSPLASLIKMVAYTPSRERNESGLFFFSNNFKIMLSTVS